MLYYVIVTNEDGDVSMSVMTRETLLKAIEDKHWGDLPYRELNSPRYTGIDLRNSEGIFIVKGDSVLPTPKQVVTEWEI